MIISLENKTFLAILLLLGVGGALTFFKSKNSEYLLVEELSGSLFYPSDKAELQNVLARMLDPVRIPKILIVPHAGYQYSGRIAAKAYRSIRDAGAISTVVLIGPSHFASSLGVCFSSKQAWRNELGLLKIDVDFCKSLSSKFAPSDLLPEDAFNGEHSLKVQIPFLQTVVKTPFKIVPILLNSDKIARQLALGLFEELKFRSDCLIVISTDLCHYKSENEAVKKDFKLVQALFDQDLDGLFALLNSKKIEACGSASLLTGLYLSNFQNLNFEQFQYGSSGDAFNGASKSIVSYLSGAFFQTNLTDFHKKFLMTIAQKAVTDAILKKPSKNDYKIYDSVLLEPAEVFVTLKTQGELRGCVGNSEPLPLAEAVVNQAYEAVGDSRFERSRLTSQDLEQLKISISILSKKIKIADPKSLMLLGTHGIMLQNREKRALFLPKVAIENNWDIEKTLQNLCQKAGLSKDAWQDEETSFWIFTSTEIDLS